MSTGNDLQPALRWAAVGDLSARVAHESNNLLAGILGQAELGLLSNDPARMRTALEAIVRSSRDLKTVTERLLVFSKSVDAGHESTSLVDAVRNIFGILERAFAKAGVQIERRYGPLPLTWCDSGTAALILLWALRAPLEALRASGGGTLEIEASAQQGNALLTFRATLPEGSAVAGLPDRAGVLTRREAELLAEGLGGSLALDRHERGWTIACRFPLRARATHDEEAAAARMEPAAPTRERESLSARPPAGEVRILVVDDEAPIRDLLQRILEGPGRLVTTCEGVEEALEALGRDRFELVLTDLTMPGLDGIELIRRLRGERPGIPVAAVTGRATDDLVRAALEAGALAVLRKPFEVADVRSLVASLLADPTGAGLEGTVRRGACLLRG